MKMNVKMEIIESGGRNKNCKRESINQKKLKQKWEWKFKILEVEMKVSMKIRKGENGNLEKCKGNRSGNETGNGKLEM